MLGPLEVRADGEPLGLGGTKPRALLALLLSEANRVVSAGRLVDALWGGDDTDRTNTLHVHVANLRKALSPAADALGVEELVVTQKPGYVVRVATEQFDVLMFKELAGRARYALDEHDADTAANSYRAALALVRGEPLADLADEPFAREIATHLSREVARAHEDLLDVELMRGNHREVLSDIQAQVEADPLNEHLRELLMVALYRCGRQADALAAFQDARHRLVEELGVEPSPELRDLEARVLAQDPLLRPPPPGYLDVELRTIVRSSVIAQKARVYVDDEQGIVVDRPMTTIGRAHDCDIRIDDGQVSRLHARIRLEAGEFAVADAGSTNGTWVNGQRVREQSLRHGDEIRIGDHLLRFELTLADA
jgi:DNA-binding SARP family transcriptional activator